MFHLWYGSIGFHIMSFQVISSNTPSAQFIVSLHVHSFALPPFCSNYDDFLSRQRPLVTRLLSKGYKCNRLSNTFKKFYGRHTDLVGRYKKSVCQMFDDSTSYIDTHFCQFAMAELIKLAKMEGVLHGADHTYCIRSTWRLH